MRAWLALILLWSAWLRDRYPRAWYWTDIALLNAAYWASWPLFAPGYLMQRLCSRCVRASECGLVFVWPCRFHAWHRKMHLRVTSWCGLPDDFSDYPPPTHYPPPPTK